MSPAISPKSRLKDGCRQNWPPYIAIEMAGTGYSEPEPQRSLQRPRPAILKDRREPASRAAGA